MAETGKVYGIAFSFEKFDSAIAEGHGQVTERSYWLAAAMFISALLQKKMQTVSENKGLTVLVMDDNKAEMPALSDLLYKADPWFDGLYQQRGKRRRETVWLERTNEDRFDQIINTAFAIKSEHSSLVQVADAVSFIYRRNLELLTANEAYAGEADFYNELCSSIEPRREKLGQTPTSAALNFYRSAGHPRWRL